MSIQDDARWGATQLAVHGEAAITNAKALLTSCADELDRLNTRLEVSPDHPYDGIACRDESIRCLENDLKGVAAQRDALRNLLSHCRDHILINDDEGLARHSTLIESVDAAIATGSKPTSGKLIPVSGADTGIVHIYSEGGISGAAAGFNNKGETNA